VWGEIKRQWGGWQEKKRDNKVGRFGVKLQENVSNGEKAIKGTRLDKEKM